MIELTRKTVYLLRGFFLMSEKSEKVEQLLVKAISI